jgi:hypothetical protein
MERKPMYVVKQHYHENPKVFWYWQGVTSVAGIGFAAWGNLVDATKYRTKREASQVCNAWKQRRPKTADLFTVEKVT